MSGGTHNVGIVDGNGLSVNVPTARTDRRAVVRRLGMAAAGLGLAGGAAARATPNARAGNNLAVAGNNVAVTNAPNTFTADQTVFARLGVGRSPLYPLHLARSDAGAALAIQAHTMALFAFHDTDWGGQTYDLVNLFHKSCGDAIFIAHQGGKPPNFVGDVGGIGGLNVLVPYYLDDTATGRNGSVVNDRTGMRGIFHKYPGNE